MSRTPWAGYFWPGLPQICVRGSWAALLEALAATMLFNAALVASFVYSELVGSAVRTALWVLVAMVWIAGAGHGAWWIRRFGGLMPNDPQTDPFRDATDYYLRGDYFQAERILGELLRRFDGDIDARLMLVTLLRRTGRIDEAVAQLKRLRQTEGAGKWALEIAGEDRLLTQLQQTKEEVNDENEKEDETSCDTIDDNASNDSSADVRHAA